MTKDERRKTNVFTWQCRRGMLELDLLLNNFVEKRGATLEEGEKETLVSLLSYPDQVLLDLLLGNSISSDPAIAELVKSIQLTEFSVS